MSTDPAPVPVGWEPDISTFGARLALVRQHMGWNVKEAATACGIAAQSWRQWESGMGCRSQENVSRKISSATGCSYTWLCAGPAASAVPAQRTAPTRGASGPGSVVAIDVANHRMRRHMRRHHGRVFRTAEVASFEAVAQRNSYDLVNCEFAS